ncbi:hypothetical protein SETIT_6G223000v2 [Setaria italica]|uniref:C2 domain-containing protein n=1 Tax=Setaria italica TaxID=4555 RepID=A0A368RPB7_SETIT|nr:hypothetical protein SETIT_6G223000v2 [Setaria italica]
MGVISIVFGFSGFGFEFAAGIVIGYFLFVNVQPNDVKNSTFACPMRLSLCSEITLLGARDHGAFLPKLMHCLVMAHVALARILPEIPLWVKNPDYDRIDWLNRFLELMWPYLNKAICRTAEDITKPIIAENTSQYKIDSVEFETLTLGSLPPTFQGQMKVYVTEEHELIMEPSLRGCCGSTSLCITTYYSEAIGPYISFAKILVSLVEKPHVDFGLKLLGADVTIIPGLYRFVQETIKKKQVASMYLLPKTLEVPIIDPSKASKKPVGILLVKVVRAQNLRKKDLLGKSDPYVKLKMSDDKLPSKKTTVKRSNLNPEWNEDFKFVVTDPETQALEFNVFDWEQVGKHEKMSMNRVLLKDLPAEETKVTTLDLLKTMDPNDVQNEKLGQLTLELTYKPFKEEDMENEGTKDGGGLLYVIVHEAQDLKGKHHTNPYAKISFIGEEKKTKVIKKNRDPRWEDEFEFVCEEPPRMIKYML